jgi:hypothetical protein
MRKKPGTMPVFVHATRLYVHYRFKTHQEFDVHRAVRDEPYARELLYKARAAGDPQLQQLADRFEAVRFPVQLERTVRVRKMPLREILRRG